MPNNYSTTQAVYDWNIYKFQPVHPDSPYLNTELEIEPTDAIIGAGLPSWSGGIAGNYSSVEAGVKTQRDLLIERIPYVAQNTWNLQKNISYKDMVEQVDALNARLYHFIDSTKNNG